jgi:hypothetical protein
MLGSASYLGLSLVCAHGTPVADMLAHSPPLPLIIDRVDKNHCVNAADEERIILALRHRDRVRRIRLLMPIANMQKLIVFRRGISDVGIPVCLPFNQAQHELDTPRDA